MGRDRSDDSSNRQKLSGFTIVELLIVVVVIAILAAITLLAYNGITNQGKNAALDSSLQQYAKKLELYRTEHGTYPDDKTAAGITDNGSTTFQYTSSNDSRFNTFYLTATANGISKHIATGGKPVLGHAPGHTGTSPNTAADGKACPSGYIVVPGNSLFGTDAFCVMKYEAKNNGSNVAVSTQSGTPWASISQINSIARASEACEGCHLTTDNEWLTVAHNVLGVASNWSGGAVGSGYIYSGHNDNSPANSLAASSDGDGYSGTGQTSGNQRRTLTLSNGQVIWDLAGNVYESTQQTTEGANRQPGLATDAAVSWRDWRLADLQLGAFASSHVAYGSPAGATWNASSNGIGRAHVNHSETGLRAALRGGNWSGGSGAGVLTLSLYDSPSNTYTSFGFRVAR